MRTPRLFSHVMHVVSIAIFAGCTYYDINYLFIPDPTHESYEVVKKLAYHRGRLGGRWKYLTNWGLAIQLIYYVVALVNDVVGSSALVKRDATRLQRVRDVFFSSIVFPIGLLVGVLFWGVVVIDRELMLPAIMEEHYPLLLNHGVHTMPAVLGLLELMLEPHNFACNRLSVALLTAFLACYLVCIMYLALVADLWVYGFLRVLSWPLRFVFIVVSLAVTVMVFFTGKALDRLVWGGRRAAVEAGTESAKKRL